MRKRKLAVLGSLFAVSGLFHTQAWAAGFVTLPTTGSSAYVACKSVGYTITFPPLADSACVAPNAINGNGQGVALSFNSTPEPGYTLGTSNTRTISAFAEAVGTLNERVFRNASAAYRHDCKI